MDLQICKIAREARDSVDQVRDDGLDSVQFSGHRSCMVDLQRTGSRICADIDMSHCQCCHCFQQISRVNTRPAPLFFSPHGFWLVLSWIWRIWVWSSSFIEVKNLFFGLAIHVRGGGCVGIAAGWQSTCFLLCYCHHGACGSDFQWCPHVSVLRDCSLCGFCHGRTERRRWEDILWRMPAKLYKVLKLKYSVLFM